MPLYGKEIRVGKSKLVSPNFHQPSSLAMATSKFLEYYKAKLPCKLISHKAVS